MAKESLNLGRVLMKAIGVDMIEIDRIAQTIEKFGERFLRRVFTSQELSYCQSRVASFAVRWAAKEAMSKTFGTGIGDVAFTEIEILNTPQGKPTIVLHGQARKLAEALDFARIEVSLSHTKAYAVAFVVID